MLAFVATLLLTATHAGPFKQPSSRIVNGISALASDYPFIADLRYIEYYTVGYAEGNETYNMTFNITSDSYCTGSLIQLEYPATILTAAHCLDGMSNYTLGVFLLRSDQDAVRSADNNYSFHVVSEYVIHPDYDSTSTDSDIGLMFLDEDLSANKRLEAVTLPTDDGNECCADGDELEVIGYGADFEDGNATDTLEYTTQNFLSREECTEILNEYEWPTTTTTADDDEPTTTEPEGFNSSIAITDTMICAAGINTDSCQGDSGGPLIKAGTTEQVGVTSWGIGCNRGLPGVYVNLKVFREWIAESIDCAADATCTFEDVSISNSTDSMEPTSGNMTDSSEEPDSEDETTDGVAAFQTWMSLSIVIASALAIAA